VPRDAPEQGAGGQQQQQQGQQGQQGQQKQEEKEQQQAPPPSGPPRFLYCYVFCRQRKDPRLPRGGEQVSVVVASEHPFGSALLPLARAAGPLYLSQGPPALQALYEQAAAWPPPAPGSSLQLPVAPAGLVVAASVPAFDALPPPQPRAGAATQAALARRNSRRAWGSGFGSRRGGSGAAAAAAGSELEGRGSGSLHASGSLDSLEGPERQRSFGGSSGGGGGGGGAVNGSPGGGGGGAALGRRSRSLPALGPGADSSGHGAFAEVGGRAG
jgi:hypothetical protein